MATCEVKCDHCGEQTTVVECYGCMRPTPVSEIEPKWGLCKGCVKAAADFERDMGASTAPDKLPHVAGGAT